MKKIIFFSAFSILLFAFTLNAQPWLEYLPKDKIHKELTLPDYQKAFNIFLESFNDETNPSNIIARENGLEKFKRWEYYMEGVVDPETKTFPSKTGVQVVREHKKTNPEVYANTPKASNWNSLGPFYTTGGYAGIGRINCIAFHPTNSDIWWVGAASGGLWCTTNNGASWECLTDDNGVLAVSDIIIPPDFNTSKTIYIATGDRDAGDNNSIGVLKSTDGGITWNGTGISYTINQGRRVNRLLLDPNDNNTIIAATSVGVYKTTDGGATWNTQLSTQSFIDMEYKPGNFNTLYGSRGTGIWRTTDGGENWERTLSLSQQRTEIAVTPDNPNIVYAVVSNNSSGLYGVFKSTNSGEIFQQVAGSSPNMLGWERFGTDGGGQGWYDLCIAVSPTNENMVLIGGVNTWRSTNGGTNWQIVNHWWGDGVQAVHADKHTLTFRNDGILFEGNDGGIYLSQNNGTNWIDRTSGMRISQMYKLGCSATVVNEVITGLQDNGSKLYSNNNWKDVYGGDGMECLIDYSDVNIQYCSIYFGNFFRTTDRWNTDTAINPAAAGNGAWVTPLVIHPTDPKTLYAGYQDLWKTTDRGKSWTKISNVNTSNLLKNIAICESDPNVIYMADNSRIWKTIDGGDNWKKVYNSLFATITSLCVKNNDPNTIWYSGGGYNTNSVYKSTDGGAKWTNISAGLPSLPFYSIVFNKLGNDYEQLYAGSEVGVYFKDGENEWVAFNNGLPNVKIGELEIYYDTLNPENCRLRAATYGRGLWESPVFNPTIPVAGTVSGANILCEKEVAQLYLTGCAGVIQWQESVDVENWNDIVGANTAYYQSEPLIENRYYRAKVTIGYSVYSNPFFVEIKPLPETPFITKIENSLFSSSDEGNQWYNQDGLIPGANEKVFTPTENGTYFVIVTLNDCSSELSNEILIEGLSIGGNAIRDGRFLLFPNPANDQLRVTNYELLINRVVIIDMLGKEVVNIYQNDVNEITIDMSKVPPGLFQVRIETDKGTFTSKVVKR